jgi:hypothetical protein
MFITQKTNANNFAAVRTSNLVSDELRDMECTVPVNALTIIYGWLEETDNEAIVAYLKTL